MFRRLVIVIALSGCHDADLEHLRSVRDQVCQCRTPECAVDAMKQLPTREVRHDHRAQALAGEMLTCLAKLYTANRPADDPDAEQPEDAVTSPGSSAPASARTP